MFLGFYLLIDGLDYTCDYSLRFFFLAWGCSFNSGTLHFFILMNRECSLAPFIYKKDTANLDAIANLIIQWVQLNTVHPHLLLQMYQ